tara:strand:- start:290 stop:448 length:159 start_codon:yes stop_codon:yes gene_type:complete
VHTSDGLVKKTADRAIWANSRQVFHSKSAQKSKYPQGIKILLGNPSTVPIIT